MHLLLKRTLLKASIFAYVHAHIARYELLDARRLSHWHPRTRLSDLIEDIRITFLEPQFTIMALTLEFGQCINGHTRLQREGKPAMSDGRAKRRSGSS